jgi:hypothetical protein
MDMADVGFGPAYDCRAEGIFGDRDGPGVNPELRKADLATKSHNKSRKAPGGRGTGFLCLPEFRLKDSDWRLDPL